MATTMGNILDYPVLYATPVFLALWLSTRFGAGYLRKRLPGREDARDDFNLVLTTTLTMLGLLIGFTFSMAVSRYDQRKNYESQEANTISTEYVRADLLPDADRAKVRELLRKYLDARIAFYTTRDAGELRRIDARTAQLQAELWAAVLAPAKAQPTPTVALAVSGMNEVLDSQGYALAALWNRIPLGAWLLLGLVSICCTTLIGYSEQHIRIGGPLSLILPVVLSVSLALIADIDAPRGGLIRVAPENLMSLVETMRGP